MYEAPPDATSGLSELDKICFGKTPGLSRQHWRRQQRVERAVRRRYGARALRLIDDYFWGRGTDRDRAEGKRLDRIVYRELEAVRARVRRDITRQHAIGATSRAPRRAGMCSGRPPVRRASRATSGASSASGDDGPAEPPAPAVGRRCTVCNRPAVRLADGAYACPAPQCPGAR